MFTMCSIIIWCADKIGDNSDQSAQSDDGEFKKRFMFSLSFHQYFT